MVTFTTSDLRANLAKAIAMAEDSPVMIEKHGRAQGVLLSAELFDTLVSDAEELADIVAFDESMAEEGDGIPWEEVKAELGW